jgi:hypothetical protein
MSKPLEKIQGFFFSHNPYFIDKLHDLPTNANPIPLPSRSFFVDLLYQYGSLHEMAPDLNCVTAGIQFADDQ